jgi:hypothetical protein
MSRNKPWPNISFLPMFGSLNKAVKSTFLSLLVEASRTVHQKLWFLVNCLNIKHFWHWFSILTVWFLVWKSNFSSHIQDVFWGGVQISLENLKMCLYTFCYFLTSRTKIEEGKRVQTRCPPADYPKVLIFSVSGSFTVFISLTEAHWQYTFDRVGTVVG